MDDTILEQESDAQSYGFYAFNILKTKAKELFKQDSSLFCLSKSDTFLKELLNLYNKLYYFNIFPEQFCETIKNNNIKPIDKKRLDICSELYKVYLDIMSKNNYSVPICTKTICNKNITEESLCKKIADFENYECIEFADVQEECDFLVKEIKNLVETKHVEYRDIAVFADKSQIRQKILDVLKTAQIPVLSNIYNEEYENLKYKISTYNQISAVLNFLKVTEFSLESIKSIQIISRAEKEIRLAEFDELIKIILLEIINSAESLDKIFLAKENSQKTLLEVLFANFSILSEQEKESINKEFGLLKHFYQLYLQNKYSDAIKLVINSKINSFTESEIKKTVLKKIKSLEQLQTLYNNVLFSEPDFDAFFDILQWLGNDKTNQASAVTLESIETQITRKKQFKYVFVLGLTENNFPGTNKAYSFVSEQTNMLLSDLLQNIASDFGLFVNTDEFFYSQKLTCLQDIVTSAKEYLFLTMSVYENKKQVQPSSVFKLVSKDVSKFRRFCKHTLNNQDAKIIPAVFDKPVENKVISESMVLKLSASSINTYNNCQRKYYYKHLLNLKESYTFSASYGSIVHAVFELLNRKYLTVDKFTKEVVLELGNILFDSKHNPDKALLVGFRQTDIDLVNASDTLSLAEMKNNFIDAIDDFSMSGGFDNLPKSVECEKSFTFEIPEIPDVVFEGRIDAIFENNDGKYCVIDYKTGHDKTNSLDYAISDNGVNFLLKSGKEPANKENLQKVYDYQIPIYYLACQNAENLSKFRDKIDELGLVYIRPKSKDNGCWNDLISASRLESYKAKIIQNLKETVVDKIKNTTEFKPNKSFNCDNCAYKFLCDLEATDE